MSRRVVAFGGPCCDPELERTCQNCQRVYCMAHDGSAIEPDYCPECQDPFAALDAGRAAHDHTVSHSTDGHDYCACGLDITAIQDKRTA